LGAKVGLRASKAVTAALDLAQGFGRNKVEQGFTVELKLLTLLSHELSFSKLSAIARAEGGTRRTLTLA
jgi:hypothetical protein